MGRGLGWEGSDRFRRPEKVPVHTKQLMRRLELLLS